jgi:hypothetical protein
MIREARTIYERYKNRGKLAQRAALILNEKGKRTQFKNRPFTATNLYPYISGDFEDPEVDLAIIEAAKQYEAELTVKRGLVSAAAAGFI